LTTFHKYPSAGKRVEGVFIFESMVSNAGIRPGYSGAQYTYTRDSTIAKKSLKSASHYLGRVGAIVSQASALRDKMRGVDAKEKDGYCHERVVWVKYDGDRLSRQMVTTFDILEVDAPERLVDYCLACSRSRLLQTMGDVFSALEGDREITILHNKDAFVSRK
jgi:hypothetical protein